MKKKLLALSLALTLFAAGCGTTAGKTASGTDSLASATESQDSTPVKDDTIDKAGIDAFIALPEYKGIALTKKVAAVTDAELNSAIETDLNQYRIDVPQLPIDNKYWVTMDYTGTVDGKSFDGGTATDYELKIGQGTMPTEFEDQLKGHLQGDEVTIDVTYADDYSDKNLAGKKVTYDVKITRVSVALGEATNDWTEMYFQETLDDYRARKLSELQEAKSADADKTLLSDAWLAVYDQSTVLAYPKDLLNTWIKYGEDTYSHYAETYSMSYDDFLKEYGVTEETIQKNAKDYTKTYLVATAIMEKEGIAAGGDAYTSEENTLLQQSGYDSEDAAVAAGISKENIDMTVRYYLAGQVIKDNANVTEETTSVAAEDNSSTDTAESAAG